MSVTEAKEILARAKSVVALTGAGISAESGLATFRGSDGLWEGHRVENVATPEAFAKDPLLVWNFYSMRREQASAAQPNAGHVALAQWESKFASMTLLTQNVDGLHQRAGSTQIFELHGSLWVISCRSCGSTRPDFQVPLPELPPRCGKCGAMERPEIVWFGEGLPEREWTHAVDSIEACDVLVVIGTSAQVFPVAGLIPLAAKSGAKVIEVNPDETAMSDLAHVRLRLPAAVALPQLA